MESFLRSLFEDALGEERRLGIFTLPDCHTRHFTSVEEAASYARSRAGTHDTYFHVGLAGGNFDRRSSSADIAAIGGLWADIDLVAPWRKDKALPRKLTEARGILDKLPFPPSLLVDSGHGLHAWWLFKEPWVFDSDEERIEARRFAKGWHEMVCRAAGELGWSLENLGDLARVLRPPGTFNRKGETHVEVRVVEDHPECRYNPTDFEPFAAEDVSSDDKRTQTGTLVLHPGAEPRSDRFAQLLLSSPAFAQAWDRRRPELADQSQSAYDLSLANIAALNGWSDQEIADLLIAARRKHGRRPEKALRMDYMARTIGGARHAAPVHPEGEDVDLSGLLGLDALWPKSLGQLRRSYPRLREPVIHGLLREGETMNVIASSKLGKSWLVIDLALAVATGRPWLDFECVPGDVLVIDNELHGETSANRIPRVADARGIDPAEVAKRLHVQNLRGRLVDLYKLKPYFRKFEPGRFKLVVLDAFYRFLPTGTDENDNGAMAGLYNLIDSYADHLRCSFVLIHHTSKGNQSLKSITDVGAGAGAQSRATDTHLVLRRHEETDAVVLDAAVRSWPPVAPRCLRWAFPVWMPADDLDPAALRRENKKRAGRPAPEPTGPEDPAWTVESFVEAFVRPEPRLKASILDKANGRELSDYQAGKLIRKAEARGLIHRWKLGANRHGYATEPQPELDLKPGDEPEQTNKREALKTALRESPGLSNREIARRCDASHTLVNRVRKELGL